MKACTQCGRCCTNPHFMLTLSADVEDVGRWYLQERWDILQYLEPPLLDLWISPTTGDELPRCPFVRKRRGQDVYDCRIYETRPTVCRNYPSNVSHMKAVDCEMLEDGDTTADVRRFMASARHRNGTETNRK